MIGMINHMKRKYVLGIDLGTSSCKTVVLDETGQVVADAAMGYSVNMPRLNWVEQDPTDWWNAVVLSIRKVLDISLLDPSLLVGVGLSGQMHGLVALDDMG